MLVQAIADALKGLAANLLAGVRMAMFLRITEDALRTTPQSLLALVFAVILVRLGADLLLVGLAGGEWVPEGLPGVLFPVALGVMVAAGLAAASGNPQMLAMLLVALLAVGLSVEGIIWALRCLGEEVPLPSWADRIPVLAPVWLALAASKAMAQLLPAEGVRRVAVYASLMLFVALPLASVRPNTALWSPVAEEDSAYDKKYDALTEEEAFYQQPKLLAQALADVRRQRPGQTDLFFVGMAGDAEQGVFLREVQAVQKMMAERFGAFGHTVALANNYTAAKEYPLASVTGLRQTLRRVGEVMDKENDILFLFITSHGGRDHSVLLDFWPLHFNPLNPEVLRQVLDESGIQWRVVVVSACYSGGFIETLQNPQTIVITAAAPDRTSFGCSDENEWTYFGKAFFDDALRHESDLQAAFEAAREAIARREQEEKIDVISNPMIAVGPAMDRKWRSFVRERAFAAELLSPSDEH